MELANDTLTHHPDDAEAEDPQKIGSGDSDAPGGKDAPAESISDLSHSQEAYPGPSPHGESEKTGAQPSDTA